ncbi:hypothetical protein MKX01_007407 [Papaver californicum]|nr:hypothetical protein MKX01_007407 [Papaver californicum]
MSSSNTSSTNISSNNVSPPSPSPLSSDEKPENIIPSPPVVLLPEMETASAPEVSNPQSPPPPSSPPPSPPPSSPPPTPPPSSPPPSSPPPNSPPQAPVTSPSPPLSETDSSPVVDSPVTPSPPPPFPSPPPPVIPDKWSQNANSLSPSPTPTITFIFPPPSPGISGLSPPIQFPPPIVNPLTPLPGSQTGPTSPGWSTPPAVPSTPTPDSAHNLIPHSTSNPSPKSGNNRGVVIGAAAAAMGVVVLAMVAFLFFMVKKKRKRGGPRFGVHYGPTPGNVIVQPDGYFYVQQPQNLLVGRSDGLYNGRPPLSPTVENHNGSSGPDSGVIGLISCFSYEDLMEITIGFSKQNILGQGGFGCVYKGWLLDGRAVAVKQLKTGSSQGEREFRAEVEIISRVHHRHLVSLVGYCIAENQRLLVYEFLPNNNLDHHLHGKGMPVMEWPKRLKIALGAARGLAYLHDDCNPKIIHRDIKSANILLDDTFEAQVSDFGLAKLAIDYNTHVSTRVVGTARPLLIHALDTGNFAALIDPKLESRYVESEMLRMIEAAAACVRHAAPRRPRMLQVLRALDSECDGLIDLNNGLKLGQSTAYDSAEYSVEIKRFRRMAFGSWESSDYDTLGVDGQSSNGVSVELEESGSAEFPSSSDSESHLMKSPHSKQRNRLKPR